MLNYDIQNDFKYKEEKQKQIYNNYRKSLLIIYKDIFNYKKLDIDLNNLENNFNKYKIIFRKYPIFEIIDKKIPIKIYMKVLKKANKKEYENRYKLIAKFNTLFKSFIKKKYIEIDEKNLKIWVTDISYSKDDLYIISFYIIVSHEIGVFNDKNNIKIVMEEFNKKLKTQKDFQFGDNFIDLKIYDNQIYKNVYTYNKDKKNVIVNVNNGIVNKPSNIWDIHYFINSLVGYYGDISNIIILDNKINTLDNYFNKLTIKS